VTKKKQPQGKIRVELDFKQTVLAALETPPEPKKKVHKKNRKR
jgi:hypothetical protein